MSSKKGWAAYANGTGFGLFWNDGDGRAADCPVMWEPELWDVRVGESGRMGIRVGDVAYAFSLRSVTYAAACARREQAGKRVLRLGGRALKV